MSNQSKAWGWGTAVLVVAVSLIAYSVWTHQKYLDQKQRELEALDLELKSFLKENESLSQKIQDFKDSVEWEKVRKELETVMSALRELPLKTPVNYEGMKREEFGNYVISKIRSEYTEEETRNYENGLKRMGLIPYPLDLIQALTDLLSEQVCAFYDPELHKLFTFPGANPRSNSDRTVLAHELVHALQDQNFSMEKLGLHLKNNDDQVLAASSLVEGDATYQMDVYLQKNFRTDELLKDIAAIGRQKMDQFQSAPHYLRDTLVFPYEEGLQFISYLHEKGGNRAIDEAFKKPPQSTEQILHPEKYIGVRQDSPQQVNLNLKLDPEWKKVQENVLGELGIRSLLSMHLESTGSVRAAEGWGGDRYEIFERQPSGEKWLLVWKTSWDTPRDAREFFDALELYYKRKYYLEEIQSTREAESVFFSESPQRENMTIRGKTVVFISAPDTPILQKVMQNMNSNMNKKR